MPMNTQCKCEQRHPNSSCNHVATRSHRFSREIDPHEHSAAVPLCRLMPLTSPALRATEVLGPSCRDTEFK